MVLRKRLLYGKQYVQLGKEAEDVCAVVAGFAKKFGDEYAQQSIDAPGGRWTDSIGPIIDHYISSLYLWYEATYISTKWGEESSLDIGIKAVETYLRATNLVLGPRPVIITQTAMGRFSKNHQRIEYILALLLAEEFKVDLKCEPNFLRFNHDFFRYCMNTEGINMLKIRFPRHDEYMRGLMEIGGYLW